MKKRFLILMFLCLFATSCSNSNNITSSGNGSSSTKPNDSSTIEPDLPGKDDNTNDSQNSLIVYFSYSGNTEDVANTIHNNLGSNIVKITPEIPYTAADVDYTNSSSRSQVERRTDARPEISSITYDAYNLSNYQNILIGYPIWNGYSPMIIKTYLEHEHDSLIGKNIYTFSTSASSSGSSAFNELKTKYNDINFKDFLHLTSSQLKNMDSLVSEKINSWNLKESEDNMRKINLTFGNKSIIATLGDNKPANDLLERLKNGSITLDFSDFGNSEKIAYPNPNLDIEGEDGFDPEVGDIAIYKPWNNIAIFYKDSASYSSDLIYVGKIDEDYINIIQEIPNNSTVIISLN